LVSLLKLIVDITAIPYAHFLGMSGTSCSTVAKAGRGVVGPQAGFGPRPACPQTRIVRPKGVRLEG
jgi:hypothetical protein